MLYRFNGFVLDPARRELTEGSRPVAVEPQVFDLLLYLIENAERVVSRDDLIREVWGGRIVSESTLATRINAARRAIGDDGTAQRLIKTVLRKGIRFVGTVASEGEAPRAEATSPQQAITFCRAADSVSLAIGVAGQGPVLLKTANWLNHLEFDWVSPLWSPMFRRLAKSFRFVRYDGRGNGLSDREVADLSFAGFSSDLDAVTESLGLERFSLFGISQGAATAVAYAVRHPERVERLILHGGYAQGRNRRGKPEDAAAAAAFVTILRQGWGDEHSAFMRAFSSVYLPSGTSEQIGWFAELQRRTTSAEAAAHIRLACDDIDVTELLPRVQAPTLILHSRRDNVVPLDQGRLIASRIPQARFVGLDSENHVPLPGEPAWERLLSEIEAFMAEG